MNPTLKIRTPEGIEFSFRLAGPVVRCLAWSIDFLVTMVAIMMLNMLAQVGGFISPDISQAVSIIALFIVWVGYGMFFEWIWRGQTLGKRLLSLRVVDAQGLRLQFYQILLRNLLRFVDALPALYLVGGLATVFSRRAQRLGDLAANTVVVYNPKPAEPDLDQLLAGKFNSLRQHPHLEARLRQRVSPDEARLALQAIIRRDELDPEPRVALFSELADHFKGIVHFPPEAIDAMPDEQYVRNVVDILFRTRAVETKPSGKEMAVASR